MLAQHRCANECFHLHLRPRRAAPSLPSPQDELSSTLPDPKPAKPHYDADGEIDAPKPAKPVYDVYGFPVNVKTDAEIDAPKPDKPVYDVYGFPVKPAKADIQIDAPKPAKPVKPDARAVASTRRPSAHPSAPPAEGAERQQREQTGC